MGLENRYSVYLFRFPNDKYYAGITTNIRCRFRNHKCTRDKLTKVSKAIEQFGWDNIVKTIVATDLSRQEAHAKEVGLSNRFNTIENGYNIIVGNTSGMRGKFGQLSLNFGQKRSDETKVKLANLRLGSKATELTKIKMSKSRSGVRNHKAKKVVDLYSGIVFDTVKEAAEALLINYSTLRTALQRQKHKRLVYV